MCVCACVCARLCACMRCHVCFDLIEKEEWLAANQMEEYAPLRTLPF